MKVKIYYHFILAAFFLISLSGCFSSNVINNAKYNYSNHAVSKIERAYIDSENNLYINFQLSSEENGFTNHQLKLNLDTIKNNYNHSYDFYSMVFSKEVAKKSHLILAKDIQSSEGKKGIEVVCKKGIYTKKIKDPPLDFVELDTNLFSYEYPISVFSYPGFPEIKYFPEENFIIDSTEYSYYSFLIPKYEKQSFIRYSLLPFAILLDIITFPFQFLWFILLIILCPA